MVTRLPFPQPVLREKTRQEEKKVIGEGGGNGGKKEPIERSTKQVIKYDEREGSSNHVCLSYVGLK